jgi:hypothetical protein
MKRCDQCSNEINDSIGVCPFCGKRFVDRTGRPLESDPLADTATNLPRLQTPGPSKTRVRRGAGMVVMGEGSRQPITSGGWGPWPWLLPLIALIGVVAVKLLKVDRFPVSVVTAATATEPVLCDGADRCVIAYLAPWDSASQESIRTVELMRENLAPDGIPVAVVVGHDELDNLEAMAERIGGSTWLDADQDVMQQTKVEIVPTWWLVDATGKVLERVEGTYVPLDVHLTQLGL